MIRRSPSAEDRAVYAAEDDVDDEIGPDLSSWRDLVRWTAGVLAEDAVQERFPHLPAEIRLGRRSRTAASSLASPAAATILIRDGSRSALTVLHEITHLVEPNAPHHGSRFRSTLCELVRSTCGIEAAAALRLAYRSHELAT
jgi:putative metallohydrolase (TIGR04338 family)